MTPIIMEEMDKWIVNWLEPTWVDKIIYGMLAGIFSLFIIAIIAVELMLSAYVIMNWSYPDIYKSEIEYLLNSMLVYFAALSGTSLTVYGLSKLLIEYVSESFLQFVKKLRYQHRRNKETKYDLLELAVANFIKQLVFADPTGEYFSKSIAEIDQKVGEATLALHEYPEFKVKIREAVQTKAKAKLQSESIQEIAANILILRLASQ